MTPRDLPIYELEDEIVRSLLARPRLILQAPTGSGKSTQVPQMLLDRDLLGEGEVVVLQPRRLATRMLARRVAAERNGRLGDEVGYQIRFEKVASRQTRIRFVTEGILLRQLLQDPELRGVAAILFDEFHERHLYGDITLARTLQLQETTRPELKLVVMSATLESDKLEKYLAPCPILDFERTDAPGRNRIPNETGPGRKLSDLGSGDGRTRASRRADGRRRPHFHAGEI